MGTKLLCGLRFQKRKGKDKEVIKFSDGASFARRPLAGCEWYRRRCCCWSPEHRRWRFGPPSFFAFAVSDHHHWLLLSCDGTDLPIHSAGAADFAFRNKVLLATPTNLVAIARTVAQVWRQDKMADEAREIGKMGAELYDRLRVAGEHMKRVGGGLETAVANYNKFVGSFERNVLSSGKRLADKGIEIGKREIEEVPLVEGAPRYTQDDLLTDGGKQSVE